MELNYKRMARWPALAWLAECSADDETIKVYHGGEVETRERWFCEAVWAGEFPSGGFDQTDIVAGSGGRMRDNGLLFVASGSNVDRLHSLKKDGAVFVSNSLICLLAWVDGEPDPGYLAYSRDFSDYRYAVLENHTLPFPSSAGPVEITYFADLLWNGDCLVAREKPCIDRDFTSFEDYRDFLKSSMQLVAANASHDERLRPFKLLCALSNGYDSPTIAALACEVSGIEAFTFRTDRQGVDDSGEAIAAVLGIPCHVVEKDAWRTVSLAEVPFIACSGSVGDLVFKSAESLLQGAVLLSGPSGDTVWDKNTSLSSRIAIGDGSMLGFTEYRLWTGFINCPVPLWGVRQVRDIVRLSSSAEMQPWDMGGDYNRPVCRRIVETAGVPRALFGVGKRGMSVVPPTSREFLTPSSLEDLYTWLSEQHQPSHGERVSLPDPALARLLDWNVVWLRRFTSILNRLRYRYGFKSLTPAVNFLQERLKRPYYHHRYVVHWAVDRAKRRYRLN